MMKERDGIVVLISGRGSNLGAIIDAIRGGHLHAEIRLVISNEPGAQGLKRAQAAGIPTQVIDHRRFTTRAQFEQELTAQIDAREPQLIVLAGFMRILSEDFIRHYAGRMLNIHPSLLPHFPGLNTHDRALKEGAERHGASVHFVTRDVDAGPVVIQATVPIYPDDTPEVLAGRVLKEEHRIYPLAIRWFLEGRLVIDGERVLLDGRQRPEQGLIRQDPASGTSGNLDTAQ